jgi:hypothetical protein
MALFTASTGDLAVVTSGSLRPVVSSVSGSAGGASQCPVGFEVVGASPRLGDGIGSLMWGLLVRGASASVSERTALSDVASSPRSSSAAGLRACRLYLSGSPGFLHRQ